jgi:MFS family permease
MHIFDDMSDSQRNNYRWYLLGLCAISGTLVTGIPFSCMPALFEEISNDLGLNLVQVGTIWGIAGVAAVFVGLLGGFLGDRFGVGRVLAISCIFVGITGAIRGFSDTFFILAVTVFLNGLVRAVIPINVTKLTVTWFKGRYLGVANSVGAMGMGMGLMLGPMISATILSPWLGGWRNVMFFYGALSAAVGGIWFLIGRGHAHNESPGVTVAPLSFRKTFPKLIRNKAIWLVGLTLMFRMGGIQGMTGYLPLFLRGQGWAEASADGALSLFYAVSTVFVIPIAALSDRIGRRKSLMLTGLIVVALSFGILPLVGDFWVWALMAASGLFMDSVMSILMTMLLESEGIETGNSGMALGMVFTLAPLGSIIAPPLGNSLASINPGLPFYFWAGISAISVFLLLFVKETGWRKRGFLQNSNRQPSSVS